MGSIKAGIRTVAYKNKKLAGRALSAIGMVSGTTEKFFRRALHVPPAVVEIPRSPSGLVLGSPIRMGTSEGQDQISSTIYYRGWPAFEHPLPSLMAGILTSAPDGMFFDIGANTGLYSLLSKSICPRRGVRAFEPFPPALKILKSNIALNAFAADIVVVEAAASDKEGTAQLFIPTQEHGLVETSASLSSTFKAQHSDILTIQTVRLDGYCHKAGLGPVSVMKIDVEGVEEMVFSGATELMARDKPIIFCEVLPDANAWGVIPAILAKNGYLRAAIHKESIVVQGGQELDLSAHNHILFPGSLEPLVREVARSAAVHYRAGRQG